MLKNIFLSLSISIFLTATVSAASTETTEMLLFMREGCEYCQNLAADLQAENAYVEHQIETVYIDKGKDKMRQYLEESQKVGYTAGGVPLLIDGLTHVEGRTPILNYLGYNSETFNEETSHTNLSEEDSELLNDILKEESGSAKTPTELIFWFVTAGTASILLWHNFKRRNP